MIHSPAHVLTTKFTSFLFIGLNKFLGAFYTVYDLIRFFCVFEQSSRTLFLLSTEDQSHERMAYLNKRGKKHLNELVFFPPIALFKSDFMEEILGARMRKHVKLR